MNPRNGIRVSTLVIVGLATAVVAWLALQWWLSTGPSLPHPGWLGLIAMLALTGALLVIGWPVKKLRDGTSEHFVSPLRAARTLVLAQAGALTGAALTGWYAAGILVLLPDADVQSVLSQIWVLVAHALVSVGLAVAGMVVQSWCRLLPRDENDEQPQAD